MSRLIYPGRVQFRVTAAVRAAIEAEARKAQCGEGDICRRIMLAGLNAEGVTLPGPATPQGVEA